MTGYLETASLKQAITTFVKLMPHKPFLKEEVMLAYEAMFARLSELELKAVKNG